MGTTEAEVYYGIVTGGWVFITILALLLLVVFNQLGISSRTNKRWFDEQIIGLETATSRMAHDLHDDIGSTLYAIRLKMESINTADSKTLGKIEEALEMLGMSSEKVKQISRKMMPLDLVEYGLVDSIKSYLFPLQMDGTTEIIFDADPIEDLPEKTALHLYRIVQELVHNTLQHAKAKYLSIDIVQIKDYLYLTVVDDGKGFEYKQQPNNSHGLSNIKHRVWYLGGTLHFISKPGKGCQCEIKIKHKPS